jgi:hypothetical protein
MSNLLKVSLQTTIYSLAQRGWSQRRIEKQFEVNRETIGRYLRLSKPAISIIGSLAEKGESKPTISIAGIGAGRRSRYEVFTEVIAAKVEASNCVPTPNAEVLDQPPSLLHLIFFKQAGIIIFWFINPSGDPSCRHFSSRKRSQDFLSGLS